MVKKFVDEVTEQKARKAIRDVEEIGMFKTHGKTTSPEINEIECCSRFNFVRIQESIESGFVEVPEGFDRDQTRKFLFGI